jgi:hypothetical protein
MRLEQRKFLADKLGDLANLSLGALVVGQLISNQAFNTITFALGIILASVLYFTATIFAK